MGKQFIKILLAFITTLIISIFILLVSSSSAAETNNKYRNFSDDSLTAPMIIHGCREEVGIKKYACLKIEFNWDSNQWKYFKELINRESGWNSEAQNPESTAYGLCQFLDSTWEDTGIEKTSDPESQIDACIIYIQNRYDYPEKAIEHHDKLNWY